MTFDRFKIRTTPLRTSDLVKTQDFETKTKALIKVFFKKTSCTAFGAQKKQIGPCILALFASPMVIVQAYEPSPWNESAPGAPWGGQSTIWDACRDLMLAEKGRYDQPVHLKQRRLHFELPQHSDRPGVRDPPRSATLRRMPQWPAPTFDSSAYKALQPKQVSEAVPALPTAYGRLDGNGEMLKAGVGPGPEPEEEKKSELPLELKWPGVRRTAWAPEKELGTLGTGSVGSTLGNGVGARANSSSPRYAPFRYGAAIVRQQRGIAAPPSSRGSSRLQRSASQQSHSGPSQSQHSHPSHPSHPSTHSSHPSGRNSRSISGSDRKSVV